MNDIDLNGSEENPWTPIGNSSQQYSGTFDGDGHTISGLYIDSRADYQGLFGYLSTDGGNTGTVQNLSVSGTVSGGMFVGGVVGLNHGSVENCYNIGKVSGTGVGGGAGVGGVVGGNDSGTVKNCYNTGAVSGGESVGGVVGDNGGTVENCYNTGNISAIRKYVGGVVGWSDSGTVKNCYNTGKVSGPNSGISYVGGVVGLNFGGTVTNCYNTGAVSGGEDVGGVVGYNDSGGIVTGCYFLKTDGVPAQGIGSDSSATGATGLTADQFKDQNSFTDWDFGIADTDTWTINTTLNRPVLKDNHEDDGSEDHPYEIFTATQLENFRDLVNRGGAGASAHAKLMNDIDLSSVCGESNSWNPIGTSEENAYTGTFNGQNFKISGLYIDSSGVDYKGLFGYLGTSGDNKGTVKDLSVSGSVSGDWYVGGVVGYNNGGTVTGCIFSGSGSVSGSYHVGGIVGQNRGSVENCYNTGAVSGPDSGYSNVVGGVVGWNDSGANVENCYNTGTVSGPDSGSGNSVGGVVGYNYHGASVENCYNTGAVSGPDSGSGDWYVGDVVGYNRGSVENCYNTGSVTSSGNISGGVVGYNSSGYDDIPDGSVTNCYFLKTADVNKDLPGIGFGGEGQEAIQKTADEFRSGEVAYLLQNGQKAAGEEDPIPQVWGQSALGTEDSLPTLVALNPDAAKEVYQLTFDWRYEGAPEGTTTTTNVYTNGSVAIPEINHDRAGYHISGWKDASGAPVTTETAVTADTIYTAEWTANTYTITVTAGSGGAVSGGGEYSEGTEVTVTATPATGYHFVNWTENGTEVSTEATFTFNATVDRNLIAIFAKNEDPDPTPTPTPDPEPTGPSTGDSSGWDDIRDELENAEKGEQITIDMGDETKVPAEIFESLAGKDVEISFDLGDIQWSVNGADIPTDTDFTDLDLGASLGTSGIPVNVINAITGEHGSVQMTLAHDGAFGFTMTLTAPLGKENAGYWANLYHYDEEAEALNFEAAAKIDEDGSVTIPFSHASQYAIVIDTHSHAAVDVSDLFTDIAPDAWYKDAIQYAYDNGLMTGVSATEFAPEQTTTRAMIVSILARLEGVTTAQAAGFADVDNNDWYATAVNWAANVGVVNGYEDNTFRPNTAITREQLAAILMNYASYKGEDVSNRADLDGYTDQPSTWAQEAMQWAVAEGLISGVTADTLQPQGAATRAQVAAILQRFLSE